MILPLTIFQNMFPRWLLVSAVLAEQGSDSVHQFRALFFDPGREHINARPGVRDVLFGKCGGSSIREWRVTPSPSSIAFDILTRVPV